MTHTASAQRKKLVDGLKKSFAPVKERTTDRYREAVDLLRAFAEQVAELINQPNGIKAEVKVDLGHLVNQGQEHRVAIRATEIGLSDYVLRAFIPFDGYPVVLDVFEESDRVCASAESLVAALVELSGQPAMQQRLAAIRSSLADESLRGPRKKIDPPRLTKSVKAAKSASKRGEK
jgi:hypothetical protein